MSKSPRKTPLTDEQIRESDKLKSIYNRKKLEIGVTQEKIAAAMSGSGDGVTQGAVSHFMNRRTALNADAASVFARMLEVPVSEFSPRLAKVIESMGKGLTAGIDEPPLLSGGDFTLVQQLSAKVAGGPGEENSYVEVRGDLAFKKSYLKRRSAHAEDLKVVYATGRSMEPIIMEGDAILVDTSKKELKNRAIYAFSNSEYESIIKRAVLLGRRWILHSENPDKSIKAHADMDFIDENGLQRFEIIGLAIWRGGDL